MPPKKPEIAISLSADGLERIKNAVYWLEGESMSSLMEKGALTYIDQLEAERNSPFPQRKGELRAGRPRKTTSASEQEVLKGETPAPAEPKVQPMKRIKL